MVNPVALSIVFLVVMAGALVCFVKAYGLRRDTGSHRKVAIIGASIDLFGTLAVVVTSRWLGWHVPAAFPQVAIVHRGFAYVSTATLALQVVTGATRHPIHRRLGFPFLCLYATTYTLAVWAYAPWW